MQNAKQEVSQHEFQAAQAEEEQRLLQGLLWQQKLEFREAHQKGLTEMEELRKFSEFCIRHFGKTEIHRGSEHYIVNFLAEYRNCNIK